MSKRQLSTLVLLLMAVAPAFGAYVPYEVSPDMWTTRPNTKTFLDKYIGKAGEVPATPGVMVYTPMSPSTAALGKSLIYATPHATTVNLQRLYQGPTAHPKLVFFGCKYVPVKSGAPGTVELCKCATATYGNKTGLTAANIVATSGPSDGHWIFLQPGQCKQNRTASMGCMVQDKKADAPCWSMDTVNFSSGDAPGVVPEAVPKFVPKFVPGVVLPKNLSGGVPKLVPEVDLPENLPGGVPKLVPEVVLPGNLLGGVPKFVPKLVPGVVSGIASKVPRR